jgi:hypothetical protein
MIFHRRRQKAGVALDNADFMLRIDAQAEMLIQLRQQPPT